MFFKEQAELNNGLHLWLNKTDMSAWVEQYLKALPEPLVKSSCQLIYNPDKLLHQLYTLDALGVIEGKVMTQKKKNQ